MSLQITMIKAPGSVAASNKTHTFDGSGGTIGRGDNNDFVLQDPDRFLSSQHCQIFSDSGQFFIIDLSTNGTFLNESSEPLGKGGKAQLNDGDTFEVGDYLFQVALLDEHAHASSPFDSGDQFAQNDPLSQPFDSLDASDPFGAAPYGVSDFATATGTELTDVANVSDPLQAIDRAHSQGGSDGLGDEVFHSSAADPFGGDHQTAPFAGTYHDQASVMSEAVAWPAAATQNLIPDDWEAELGPSSTGAVPSNTAQEALIEPFDAGPAFAPGPIAGPLAGSAEAAGSEAPRSPVFGGPDVVSAAPQHSAGAVSPGVSAPVGAQPRTEIPVAPVAVGSAERDAPALAAQAIFEAMGLSADKIRPDQAEQVASEVGALMREVVGGMMQVLRSRSSIKNEFRMNVTTIQPVENNPLKFSADVDEALDNMFVRRSGAYKGPVDAIREGFQEIGEHQLAMIAGIRNGFEQMMKRFDPAALESNIDKQGGATLPGLKKHKYWSGYHQYYKSCTDNMEHSFQHLFGSDFVHAYEDQLHKLKLGRKK